MSNVNRSPHQSVARQKGRPSGPTTFRSQANEQTRLKAHRTLDLLRQVGCIQLYAKPNLYKRCLDSVKLYEKLRQQNIARSNEPYHYTSLVGQQTAHLLTEATLDNVLAIFIEEKPNGKWSWDIVVDNGLIFGCPEMDPCGSYEEAEQSALGGLAMIGRSAEPAHD